MDEMFAFFQTLQKSLGEMEQKSLQAAEQAADGEGKKAFAEMLQNIANARSEIESTIEDEKRLIEKDEHWRRVRETAEATADRPIPPPPPTTAAPDRDEQFGIKVRNRLLAEFSGVVVAPARDRTFDSWIESSTSMAPDLKGAGADAGLVREIHQYALLFAPREAIWWGCISAVHVLQRANARLPAEEMQQIDRASCWVAGLTPKDSDSTPVVTTAGAIQTVGDAIALAVAIASQNLSPAGNRQYELAQEAAAAAILLTCNVIESKQRSEMLREVLQLGSDVASGKRLWPAAENRRAAVKQHEESWSSWLKNSRG